MPQPPILKTMDDMLVKLKGYTQQYRDAERAVREYTDAIRALAQVCEDEEIRTNYLLALEEISGRPGFVDAIRSVLRSHASAEKPLSARDIKSWIALEKKLNLASYSNPMASIHTTLRRMKERNEVIETENEKGEKIYMLAVKAGELAKVFPWMREKK
jgi:hypothetical protein